MPQVRRANEADLAAATDLFAEYFAAIELPAELRDDAETIAEYLDDPRALFLAYDGGALAGTIALRPLDGRDAACEIKRLYVKPKHRRRGLAEALLDALENYARERGFRTAYLDTRPDMEAALAFYLRRGYERCEPYNDNPVAAHFLRRRL